MRKPTIWFPNRSNTNRVVQVQKMARGCILEYEISFPVQGHQTIISVYQDKTRRVSMFDQCLLLFVHSQGKEILITNR